MGRRKRCTAVPQTSLVDDRGSLLTVRRKLWYDQAAWYHTTYILPATMPAYGTTQVTPNRDTRRPEAASRFLRRWMGEREIRLRFAPRRPASRSSAFLISSVKTQVDAIDPRSLTGTEAADTHLNESLEEGIAARRPALRTWPRPSRQDTFPFM